MMDETERKQVREAFRDAVNMGPAEAGELARDGAEPGGRLDGEGEAEAVGHRSGGASSS